ncbi:MAG: hypothetical protein Q9191_006851, partial [Dirinaria sp. TL-2023a]
FFKHHISILEGHFAMVDMVRKHTVEGSADYRRICEWLDNCRNMLHETKQLSQTFVRASLVFSCLMADLVQVPPSNQEDKVPLGSSFVPEYPGYSPTHHIYGEAAPDAGTCTAPARAQGVELQPTNSLNHRPGKGKGVKPKMLAGSRDTEDKKEEAGIGADPRTDASVTGVNGKHKKRRFSEAKPADLKPGQNVSESDVQQERPKTTEKIPLDLKLAGVLSGSDGQSRKPKPAKTEPTVSKDSDFSSESAQPALFVNTNPTPVNLPLNTRRSSKRTSPDAEPSENSKPKKVKKDHEGETPAPPAPGQVELLDITAEVDARMKEKEERRKRKEEKKRKRESGESSSALAGGTNGVLEVEKPKRKKSRKLEDAKASEDTSKKRLIDDGRDASEAKGKKKRKIHMDIL